MNSYDFVFPRIFKKSTHNFNFEQFVAWTDLNACFVFINILNASFYFKYRHAIFCNNLKKMDPRFLFLILLWVWVDRGKAREQFEATSGRDIVFFKVLAKPPKKLPNFRETKTQKKLQKIAKPQKITSKKTPKTFKNPLKTLFLTFFGASRRNPPPPPKKKPQKTPKKTKKNRRFAPKTPKITFFWGKKAPQKTMGREQPVLSLRVLN